MLAARAGTTEIEASGSGAIVVVVTAVGVWSIVTISVCGSCVYTAAANLRGCVIGAGCTHR